MDAGRGDGEDAFGYVALCHHVEMGFLGPIRDSRHAVGVFVAIVCEGFAVASVWWSVTGWEACLEYAYAGR